MQVHALERLGSYEIRGLIGRGGMGTVLLAWDESLGRSVAIKVLEAHDDELETRLRREARVMAELQHPHLVPILHVGLEEDLLYIVMPHLEGGSIGDRLSDERALSAGGAAYVLASVAEALHAMHAKGFVHRDIKPSNVLVSAAGDPYLADFGLAWAPGMTRRTTTSSLSGTLGYMAPELAAGEDPSPMTDVFSLGVLGYHMLAGTPPFGGSTMVGVIQAITSGTFAPLGETTPGIPPDLAVLVEEAMAAEPANRPSDLARWAQAVRTASPVEKVSPTPVQQQHCPSCDATIDEEDAAFCGKCGVALAVRAVPRKPHPHTVPTTPAITTRPAPPTDGDKTVSPEPPTAVHSVADLNPAQSSAAPPGRKRRKLLPITGIGLGVLGVVLVLVAIFLPKGGGGETEPEPTSRPKSAALNTYVTDGNLGFTVTSFACGEPVGDLAPQGKFCVAKLTVRNVDDARATTFLPSIQELAISGDTLDLDANATRSADSENSGKDIPIPAGAEMSGDLVWDVPVDADPQKMKVLLRADSETDGIQVSTVGPSAGTPTASTAPPAQPPVAGCAELQAQGYSYPQVKTYWLEHNSPPSMVTGFGVPCGTLYSYDAVVWNDPATNKVGKCAALAGEGRSYAEAYRLWSVEDYETRSLMDLHGDNVPCGSKFPHDEVVAFQRGQSTSHVPD